MQLRTSCSQDFKPQVLSRMVLCRIAFGTCCLDNQDLWVRLRMCLPIRSSHNLEASEMNQAACSKNNTAKAKSHLTKSWLRPWSSFINTIKPLSLVKLITCYSLLSCICWCYTCFIIVNLIVLLLPAPISFSVKCKAILGLSYRPENSGNVWNLGLNFASGRNCKNP